jgi:hypothetical protein
MDLLTYSCPPELASFAKKAAAVWNDVLRDLVVVVGPQTFNGEANILIKWSPGVRTANHPTRVATCRRIKPDHWEIRLESSLVWRKDTLMNRLLGRGEDTLATLVHEMGHVFDLPHSTHPADVMHPEIGGTGKLSRTEKAAYRAKFLQALESED